MTEQSLSISSGSVKLQIRGLNRTLRAAAKAADDTAAMPDLMHHIGMIVVDKARTYTPTGETHRLTETLRAGHGKTKAVVRAGGTKVPYAGVVHYGTPATFAKAWPRGHRSANRFLQKALKDTQKDTMKALIKGLQTIIGSNNFETKGFQS